MWKGDFFSLPHCKLSSCSTDQKSSNYTFWLLFVQCVVNALVSGWVSLGSTRLKSFEFIFSSPAWEFPFAVSVVCPPFTFYFPQLPGGKLGHIICTILRNKKIDQGDYHHWALTNPTWGVLLCYLCVLERSPQFSTQIYAQPIARTYFKYFVLNNYNLRRKHRQEALQILTRVPQLLNFKCSPLL